MVNFLSLFIVVIGAIALYAVLIDDTVNDIEAEIIAKFIVCIMVVGAIISLMSALALKLIALVLGG